MLKTISLLAFALAVLATPAHTRVRGQVCEAIVEEPRIEDPNSCSATATTRVELALNLDADTVRPLSLILPSVQAQVSIYDSLRNPRVARLSWIPRRSEGEWQFEVTIAKEDAIDPPASAFFDRVVQGRGSLRFDAYGSLIEGAAIPVTFAFNGGAEPAQRVVFAFRSERYRTTQFAAPSSLFAFEEDGLRCPEPDPSLGACWLAPSLARTATDSRGETLQFSADGPPADDSCRLHWRAWLGVVQSGTREVEARTSDFERFRGVICFTVCGWDQSLNLA